MVMSARRSIGAVGRKSRVLMLRKDFHSILFAWLFIFVANNSIAEGLHIHISDAWVREAPPSSTVLAGYLSIENKGDEAAVLTGISSPSFDSIMVHKSEIKEGVAMMSPVKDLVIPPGSTVLFKPGVYHLMLKGPTKRFAAGDEIELSLRFSPGGEVPVMSYVRKIADDGHSHDHTMHGGH